MRARALMATVALVIGGLCLSAMAEEATPPGEGVGRRAHGEHRGPGRAMRGKLLEKFDEDGDGKLSEEEREAAKAAMRERAQAGRRRRLSPEAREGIREKFDADGDGKLNEEEREAAKAAMKEHMQERRKETFQKLDTNGDGSLSLEEFMTPPERGEGEGPRPMRPWRPRGGRRGPGRPDGPDAE